VEAVGEELGRSSSDPPAVSLERNGARAVACSPGVLESIVGNVMRNAAKYMRDSAMKRITVRVVDKTASLLLVEIEDTGPGIPAGMEHKIFEPYVRAQGVTQAGLGLGLATVKRLCEAHGGEVGVRSTPGKGSVFWFTLPKAPVQAKESLVESRSPPITTARPQPAHANPPAQTPSGKPS
jgi:signal transduction histidine kinase